MTDTYTVEMHRKRTPAVRNLVAVWCKTRHLDYNSVREIRVKKRDGHRWTFEVETIDRGVNGTPKTLLRGGERVLSTSLSVFVADEPAWWPQ